MDLKRILSRLVRMRPGARAGEPLRRAAERTLHQLLRAQGLRAVERLIAELNRAGHRFEPVVRAAGTRTWREVVDGKHTIELYVASSRSYCAASLRYMAVGETPRRTEGDALRQRFYDRYMEVGQKAYRNARYRVPPMDRRLLLVGELEADVSNGGFSQYLDNKGRRRAQGALAALRAVGARKTAALLEQALKPDAPLSRLDDRFDQTAEDLALLAARHAGL
jgi:hypothetical protein